MALSQLTTQEVSDNIIAQIETEIASQISFLPKSFTRVLAKALGGVFVLVYKYAGWMLLQQFVQYASFRETTVNGKKITPLIEWGRLFGVGDPARATNATIFASVDVLDDTGSPQLPAGTQLIHSETGIIYITTALVTLTEPQTSFFCIASSDPDGNGGAGTQGNRTPGDQLRWANPIPQVDPAGATVISTSVTAADGETEEAYRQRIIDRVAFPPQGGAYSDYRIWAESVNGIINAYPYTGRTPGRVDVFCEADPVSAGNSDGIPTAAQLELVREAIEFDSSGFATRRPVGVVVQVEAISRQPFTVEILGLDADDIDETKAVIEEALDDYLRSREPFILGLSPLPRLDRVTTSGVAGVVDEVVSAQGGTVVDVNLVLGGVVIGAYALDYGEKAKLGRVTFN